MVPLVTADKLDAAAAHVVAPATELTQILVTDAIPQKRTRPHAERGIEILRVPAEGATASNRRSR